MKVKSRSNYTKDQKQALIWSLFTSTRALEFISHELKQSSTGREKDRISKLFRFIQNWQKDTDPKTRENYRKITDRIDETAAALMETLIHASIVPAEQIDWFSEQIKDLAGECMERQKVLIEQQKKES